MGLIEPETPGGTHRSFWDIDNSQEIEVRPALMNKQEVTRFCLAEVKKKQFSSAIHLSTVGEAPFLGLDPPFCSACASLSLA